MRRASRQRFETTLLSLGQDEGGWGGGQSNGIVFLIDAENSDGRTANSELRYAQKIAKGSHFVTEMFVSWPVNLSLSTRYAVLGLRLC